MELNEYFVEQLLSLSVQKNETYITGLLGCFPENPSEFWIDEVNNNEQYKIFCTKYVEEINKIITEIDINKNILLDKIQNIFDNIITNLQAKSYVSGCMEYATFIINEEKNKRAISESLTLQDIELWIMRILPDNTNLMKSKLSLIKNKFGMTDDSYYTFTMSIGIRCDGELCFYLHSYQHENISLCLNITSNESRIFEFIAQYSKRDFIISNSIEDIVMISDNYLDDDDDTGLLV